MHRKGDPSDPDNFRPICVLSCLCKFLTNILNSRLMDVCKKHNLIHASQIGFLEGWRTTDHIFGLKTLINKYTREKKRNNKLYACIFYFEKAYDCIWHDGLFSKLKNMNISGIVLEIIKNMYNNSSSAVKIQYKTTRFFHSK